MVARGSVIERAQSVTADGRVLSEAPIGEIGRAIGSPSICVHRAELQQVLAEAASAIELGCEFVSVAEDEGGVTVHFANGRSERGRLLIGADGIHSGVRAHLHGPTPPRRAGYVAYRGMARFALPETPPDRSRLALGPAASRNPSLRTGPGLLVCDRAVSRRSPERHWE